MNKLIENIGMYLCYLNNDLKLSVSVHFCVEIVKMLPKEVWNVITEYNSHNNPYCMFVKNKMRNKCICEQKSIYINCENDDAFYKTCHGGVYEYISPISKNGKIIGFICVSGYRGEYAIKNINNELWHKNLISEKQFPEKLCETLIPPLNIMIKKLLFWCDKEKLNEPNAIAQYLNEYHYNTTLDGLSKHFSRSKSYISHMFKKTYGTTFGDYCNKLKLKDSLSLLTQTDMPITQVAFKVGFNDVSYFINVFKRKMNVTPLQYRKKQQDMKKFIEHYAKQ